MGQVDRDTWENDDLREWYNSKKGGETFVRRLHSLFFVWDQKHGRSGFVHHSFGEKCEIATERDMCVRDM